VLNVKILGPGCANCFLLEGKTIATLEILLDENPEAFENLRVTMQHLSESEDFHKYQLISTPGLVINEKLVCAGRLPYASEIKKWVMEAMDDVQQLDVEDASQS
jgi:hypothetical protein